MNLKKIKKQVEKHGVIACLNEKEKEQLKSEGLKVEEIETPCEAKGCQGISKI